MTTYTETTGFILRRVHHNLEAQLCLHDKIYIYIYINIDDNQHHTAKRQALYKAPVHALNNYYKLFSLL